MLVEEDLLFLIIDTARLISTYADRIARRYGMSKAQWVLLMRLARHPGVTQRDLAQMMEVEPITVGRLVDRLEAHGLVERLPDEQDRRIWRLHLLPAAEPVLEALAEQRADIATMIRAGLDKDEAQVMQEGLRLVKSNVTSALGRTDPPALPSVSAQAAAKS